MNKKVQELLLYILLLGAILFIHTIIFNKIPMQFDELLMFDTVSKLDYRHLIQFLLTGEIQTPLSYLYQKAIINQFGDRTFLLRLPSLVMTFFLPWAFYRLARFSLNQLDSLKATTLLMMLYPVLIFSGSTRPYIPLLLFIVLALYEFKKLLSLKDTVYKSTLLKLIFFLLIAALLHPVGLLISVIIGGISILKLTKHKLPFYSYFILSEIAFLAIVYYRYGDFLFIFRNEWSLGRVFDFLLNLSYLTSGGAFTSVFLLLVGVFIFKFFHESKEILKKIDSFYILWLLIPVVLTATACIFLKQYIYPRHLIFLLPGIVILTIQLINANVEDQTKRTGIWIILLSLLFYKGFIKERLYYSVYEIDSKNISDKAAALSAGTQQIVSCGNCLSYYIRSSNLYCPNPLVDTAKIPSLPQMQNGFIFVEFDYSGENCKVGRLKDSMQTLGNYKYKGATVYKLAPLPH